MGSAKSAKKARGGGKGRAGRARVRSAAIAGSAKGPAAPPDHAGRAYRVLAACSHALVHAASETRMLADICQVVVDSGGYIQGWIGFPTGDAGRPLQPAAYAGFGGDRPMTGPSNWGPGGEYLGISAEAFASGETRIVRDILNDPQHARRRARARELHYQSSIALPLRNDGQVLGVLVLHAAERDAFDSDEIALLGGLADDIAFGIASLRMRAAREEAEQRSREHEKRYREAFEQAAVGLTRVGLDGALIDCNQKFCDMLGYSRAELIGKPVREITHPDDYGPGALYRARLAHGAAGTQSGEKRFIRLVRYRSQSCGDLVAPTTGSSYLT